MIYASQTINLVPGWNVVSVNIYVDVSSALLLADFVLRYDQGWETDWGVIPGDSFTLEPLRGYYVYSSSPRSILLEGIPLVDTSYEFIEDSWNLYRVVDSVSYDQEVYSVSADVDGFSYETVPAYTTLTPGIYWIQVGDTLFGPPFETSSSSFGGLIDWFKWLFTPVLG